VTDDGGLCAHYEHTIAVAPDGADPELLTLPGVPLARMLAQEVAGGGAP
jgi:hypothetical protein